MKPGEEDKRYRIQVVLVSSKRPKYWSFHCINCKEKVCELSGEIIYLCDVGNMGEQAKQPLNIRCNGKYCQFWYEFSLD